MWFQSVLDVSKCSSRRYPAATGYLMQQTSLLPDIITVWQCNRWQPVLSALLWQRDCNAGRSATSKRHKDGAPTAMFHKAFTGTPQTEADAVIHIYKCSKFFHLEKMPYAHVGTFEASSLKSFVSEGVSIIPRRGQDLSALTWTKSRWFIWLCYSGWQNYFFHIQTWRKIVSPLLFT